MPEVGSREFPKLFRMLLHKGYIEDDWQTALFGSNYNRLAGIKKQYDPSNFFNCWKCVGWTGADE
jgi:FAD/FMN-containing dehydrogenase